jgi:hypothetical protein
MATYQRVSPKFWQDPDVRKWTDQPKLFAAYLLTCPHRTTEGLFWLPRGYMAQDLGWGIDTVSEVLGYLIHAGFLAYDGATETVFLRKALKYEAPAGPKQIAGAINRLADVPPSPLFAQFKAAAEAYAPEFSEALCKALDSGALAHHRNGIDTPPDTPPKGYTPLSPSISSSTSISDSNSPSSKPSSSAPSDADAGGAPVVGIVEHPEARRLCNLLADAIAENTGERPTVGKRWLDAARLLLDKDGHTPEQVEYLIRWSQADEFWRTNILSMPKLREKWIQLVAKAKQRHNRRAEPAGWQALRELEL